MEPTSLLSPENILASTDAIDEFAGLFDVIADDSDSSILDDFSPVSPSTSEGAQSNEEADGQLEYTGPYAACTKATATAIPLSKNLKSERSMKVPSLGASHNINLAPSSNSLPFVAKSDVSVVRSQMPFNTVIMPVVFGFNPAQMKMFASSQSVTGKLALNPNSGRAAATPSSTALSPEDGTNSVAAEPLERRPRKRKNTMQRVEEAANRRAKNLASAYRSRQKRRELLDKLPVEKASLEAKVESLERELAASRAEAASLRDQCACLKEIILGSGGGGALSDKNYASRDDPMCTDNCGRALSSAVGEAPAAKGVLLLAICCMLTVNQQDVLAESCRIVAICIGSLGLRASWEARNDMNGGSGEGRQRHGGRVLMSIDDDGEEEIAEPLFSYIGRINLSGGSEARLFENHNALVTVASILVFIALYVSFVHGISKMPSLRGLASSLKSSSSRFISNSIFKERVSQQGDLPLCQRPQRLASKFFFDFGPKKHLN